MANSTRIHILITATAVTGLLSILMVSPAMATVPADQKTTASSTECDAASPRMLHNEPRLCSTVVVGEYETEVEPIGSALTTNSSSFLWIAYPAGALLAVAAAVAAFRRHPQAVS
jgi:hypothetical protein